jgi:hypothetical protein
VDYFHVDCAVTLKRSYVFPAWKSATATVNILGAISLLGTISPRVPRTWGTSL